MVTTEDIRGGVTGLDIIKTKIEELRQKLERIEARNESLVLEGNKR